MNRGRIVILSVFFAACLAAVLTEHFLLAVPRRVHYLETGRKMAVIQKEFYPPRARLLAEDGTPLAWSERYFDLVWNETVAPDSLLLREIAGKLGTKPVPEAAPERRSWLLFPNLSPEQLLKAASLSGLHPALTIRPRLERIAVNLPELREKIGTAGLRNGILYGISGWEKEYDEILRGSPGRFEVMLDRRRHWINSSWKLLEPAVPGKDVTIPYRLDERRMMKAESVQGSE